MKLDALTREQVEQARQWRNEKRQLLRTPYRLSHEQQRRFYDDVVDNPASQHRYFAIVTEEAMTGYSMDKYGGAAYGAWSEFKFVGMGGLTFIQWENRTAELSLITAPEEERKPEMFDLLLDEAFQNMGLHSVSVETYGTGDIITSEMVIEKYDAYYTWLIDRKFWDGKFWDSLWYVITEDDYARSRNVDR